MSKLQFKRNHRTATMLRMCLLLLLTWTPPTFAGTKSSANCKPPAFPLQSSYTFEPCAIPDVQGGLNLSVVKIILPNSAPPSTSSEPDLLEAFRGSVYQTQCLDLLLKYRIVLNRTEPFAMFHLDILCHQQPVLQLDVDPFSRAPFVEIDHALLPAECFPLASYRFEFDVSQNHFQFSRIDRVTYATIGSLITGAASVATSRAYLGDCDCGGIKAYRQATIECRNRIGIDRGAIVESTEEPSQDTLQFATRELLETMAKVHVLVWIVIAGLLGGLGIVVGVLMIEKCI